MPGGQGVSGAFIGGLLSALGWCKQALAAMLALAARYPWQAGCLALMACSAWLWRGENRAIGQRDAARAQVTALTQASRRAGAAAIAQRQIEERHYEELADHADARHDEDAVRVDRATARYLALHRLRTTAAAGPGGATAGQADGGGAQVPALAAADTVMAAVSEADVNTCAADYSYAKAAYDWALSLGD
jgi:hypothetical protein